MSPVHLDELHPETRAKVLDQISGTEGGTTALATVQSQTHPFYTPAEMRARSILSRIESISAKLKTLEAEIRLLWIDFDNLKAGETILGCATKKEFCERKLHRHPRTVQYLLAGQSNPADRPYKERSELSSHVEPSIPPVRPPETVIEPVEPQPIIYAEFVDAPTVPQPTQPTEDHPLEELQHHLSHFRPALLDTHEEKQFVRVLEKARTTPVADDRVELARTDVGMLREIANEMLSVADDIERHIAEVV
jgi:hypothetical protein